MSAATTNNRNPFSLNASVIIEKTPASGTGKQFVETTPVLPFITIAIIFLVVICCFAWKNKAV
jgi:hypothetical protein